MTEMNAQEKLLLKQLGQRFQLASERTAAAIVWDAPAMRHLQDLDEVDEFGDDIQLSEKMAAPSTISGLSDMTSPMDGDVPATFYRLDFGESVQQQMPEALRKRLENRKQLVQKKVPEKAEKNGDAKKSPEKAPELIMAPVPPSTASGTASGTSAGTSTASTTSAARRARPGDEVTVPNLHLDALPVKRSSSIGTARRQSHRESRPAGSPMGAPDKAQWLGKVA